MKTTRKKLPGRTLFLALLLVFFTSALYGQARKEYYGLEAAELVPGASYVLEGHNTPYPAYVRFEPNEAIELSTFFDWFNETISLNQETQFKLVKQEKAEDSEIIRYRYVQTFRDIPIGLTDLRLHVVNDKVIAFNGSILENPIETSTPSLSESDALASALAYVGAEKYMWEVPFWMNELREETGDPKATYFPEGELIWSPSFIGEQGEKIDFRPAWRFFIRAAAPHSEQIVIVDAIEGKVLKTFPMESNCEAPVNITTIWNGTQQIRTDKFETGPDNFRLRDDCQSSVMRIRDWNTTTLTDTLAVDIVSSDNTWTTMNQRFGGTVLWHTKESYKYFQNVHSFNSYDNAGGNVNGYINAVFSCGDSCTTVNNASMSFTGGRMKVGLGSSGTLLNSWGTLDIIGHEYTHAVTGASSALVYEREPGALNESFSDIFGEVIENFTTGSNDWLMGDDRTNGAIRSMSNPKNNGDPDTYQGTNWVSTTPDTCDASNDECGVHTNSGVQNYWFFLLTDGGTGTNDNSDAYSVGGIGLNKSRDIAFLNLTTQLTTNSQYADARAGAIAVATSEYGACSNEVIQVKNAWYAVGVGNPGMPTFNSSYTEPDVCSDVAFSINLQSKRTANLVTPTYTWTVSYPAGVSGGNGPCLIGCGTTINETLVNNNPNSATVVYTVTPVYDGCTGSSFTISKKINTPPIITSHPANVAAEWGDNVSFSVAFTGDPTPGVQWQRSTNGGGTFNDIGGETNPTLNLSCVTLDMDGYQYRAVVTNICGVINTNAATLNVVPRNANATITVDPDPQQYSDKVDISVTITEANVCGEFAATGADVYIGTQLMGTIVFSSNGSNLEGSLNNVALLEPVPYGTAPTGQMAPGLQNVTIVLIGVNPNFNISNPGTTLQILPEDARTYYTGACFASTSGANSSSAIVTLSATIRDITAEVGDPDWDDCPGDIRNVTLSFINRDNNTIIASNVPIGLVDPNDPLTAVGTYDWNVNIAGNSETFTIGIIIDGYYTRDDSDDDVLVTVSKPLSDFVTGGGFILLQNSAGTVSGNINSKNNFGFNVKFNKKGNNLQGNITTMVRRTEFDGVHVYKIKANNIQSLAVQPFIDGGKATINAKASIQDVTDPNNVISVTGNSSLQIKMSDWGNPGNQIDSIAITIWEKSGGLWFASNWTGTMTAEQPLAAGNLNVASNNSFARVIPDIITEEIFVYPNPSSGMFTLAFTAEKNGLYEIDLVDVMGKTIVNMLYNAEAGENVAAVEAENIAAGIYNLVLKSDNTIIGTQKVFVK